MIYLRKVKAFSFTIVTLKCFLLSFVLKGAFQRHLKSKNIRVTNEVATFKNIRVTKEVTTIKNCIRCKRDCKSVISKFSIETLIQTNCYCVSISCIYHIYVYVYRSGQYV